MEEAVEYIYSEYCLDEKGRQVRRMSAIGISMGAGILSRYVSKMGEKCKFDSCVGIGCHFSEKEAMETIKTHTLGLYNWVIGKGFQVYATEYFK